MTFPIRVSRARTSALFVLSLLVLVAVACFVPAAALAGQASAGELFFYPCTDCHPVSPGALESGRKFPGGFKGHQITLLKHDVLGKGKAACLACHADPAQNPGKLKLADGTLVDIKGDIAGVCFRCHSAKYAEWKAGTHGKSEKKCSAKGCHDPHGPSVIYVGPLLPFVGSGFQVQAVSDRQAFEPLAPPPAYPPVTTPLPMIVVAIVGALVSIALIGILIAGRPRS